MTEIVAIVAVFIALGALWLASHANKHVDSSFSEYGKHLAKQVRETQAMFEQKSDQLQLELNRIERDIAAIKAHDQEMAQKLNTLTQRLKVVEHDLKNTTDALPPQLLQRLNAKRG